MNTKPKKITAKEWAEIIRVPAVMEPWGIDDHDPLYIPTPKEFSETVYGVKFDFISGSPGYCGDLYIIHGDYVGERPLVLIRNTDAFEPHLNGQLEVVKPDDE